MRELVQTGDFFFGNVQVKVWQGVVEDLRTTFLEPCNGMFWAGLIIFGSTRILGTTMSEVLLRYYGFHPFSRWM